MISDALDTLDAVLLGLNTLAETAEGVRDEATRHRLTGTIIGLRAAVQTARDQIEQAEREHETLVAERARPAPAEPAFRERPRNSKWGCYQFHGVEGLFCPACYDAHGRRVRTLPVRGDLRCPNCRAAYPMR